MFRTITLEVIGDQRLVCAGCEERVEDLLKALPGVRQVRARARKQRIDILYDAALLEVHTMVERLRAAGYQTKAEGSAQES